ncbi:glycosyltransferase [uncultured Fusobacterium sp.]|uniref:glycosyltransferase n=1 Tax=uncultured Fusobacterium sp. TaxID=159267 RepID=UPI00262EEF5A|nr:glycosyltransferase [uncultured Fusobacterium sp.]
MERNKILYLAFRFPFPLTDGYRLRVYNYCKCLKNIGYNVDLFFIYENEEEYVDFLEKKEIQNIFNKIIPIKLTKFEKVKNLLKSILKQESLQENIYITANGKKKLVDNLKEYEKVIISYIRMYKYVEQIEKYKILDYADSLAYHYDKARYEAKGLWKLIYNYEYSKVKKLEKEVLKNVNKAMITSKIDRDYILERHINKKIEIFSQAIDGKLFDYKKEEENNNIVFIGKLDYYPNEDAILYFINEIFPYIKNYKLQIIGVNPTEKIKKIIEDKENIELLGYVENPYQIIKNSKLMVAPIRIGGGIQNKILEGMALGKVVITFLDRIKPFENIVNNRDIIAVKSTKEYIEILNNIDQDKINYIEENSQKYIKENYTWIIIQKKLEKFLKLNQ